MDIVEFYKKSKETKVESSYKPDLSPDTFRVIHEKKIARKIKYVFMNIDTEKDKDYCIIDLNKIDKNGCLEVGIKFDENDFNAIVLATSEYRTRKIHFFESPIIFMLVTLKLPLHSWKFDIEKKIVWFNFMVKESKTKRESAIQNIFAKNLESEVLEVVNQLKNVKLSKKSGVHKFISDDNTVEVTLFSPNLAIVIDDDNDYESHHGINKDIVFDIMKDHIRGLSKIKYESKDPSDPDWNCITLVIDKMD